MNDNSNITRHSVSTKASKDAEEITTNLTIDWTDMSLEDTRALARQAMIVKLQSAWRRNGIPETFEAKAVDYKVGARVAAKKDPLAMVKALPKDQQAAILAMLREQQS